jgi:glycyl-tRNA synthetase
MRDLSRQVAAAFLEQREDADYPFAKYQTSNDEKQIDKSENPHSPISNLQSPTSFVLEIGTEELPAQDVTAAIEQLTDAVPALMDDLRLDHGQVRVAGTPRRLAVYVEDLAPRQSDEEQAVKGPPARAAFDADGAPTKAALGFANRRSIEPSDAGSHRRGQLW